MEKPVCVYNIEHLVTIRHFKFVLTILGETG